LSGTGAQQDLTLALDQAIDEVTRLAQIVSRRRAQGALTPWTLDLGQPIDLAWHPLLRALQDNRAMAQAHLEAK
jgi:hypothetical protein